MQHRCDRTGWLWKMLWRATGKALSPEGKVWSPTFNRRSWRWKPHRKSWEHPVNCTILLFLSPPLYDTYVCTCIYTYVCVRVYIHDSMIVMIALLDEKHRPFYMSFTPQNLTSFLSTLDSARLCFLFTSVLQFVGVASFQWRVSFKGKYTPNITQRPLTLAR